MGRTIRPNDLVERRKLGGLDDFHYDEKLDLAARLMTGDCRLQPSSAPREQNERDGGQSFVRRLLAGTSLGRRIGSMLPGRQVAGRRVSARSSGDGRKLVMEPLEPRVLLNADLFAIDLSVALADQHDQSLLIRQIEEVNQAQEDTGKVTRVEIIDQNNGDAVIGSADLSLYNSISITTGSGNDTITVDLDSFTNPGFTLSFDGGDGDDGVVVETSTSPEGEFLWTIDGENSGRLSGPLIELAFSNTENLTGGAATVDTFVLNDGGFLSGIMDGNTAGYDSLVLNGGIYDTVTYEATGPDSGTIDLDGRLLTYAGLEPITDTAVVANRVISLDAPGIDLTPDDIAELRNNPTAGMLTLASLNGSFEDIHFAVPTDSLTINLGLGNDTLTVKSLDPAFTGNLTINDATPGSGVGTDAVIFAGNINLSGGALSVSAETITVNTNVEINTTVAAGGDAGGIEFSGEDIVLHTGARLLAGAVAGFAGGDISLKAEKIPDIHLYSAGVLLSPIIVSDQKATITATGATIEGGSVSLEATAGAVTSWADLPDYASSIVDSLTSALSQFPEFLLSQVSPVTGQLKIEKATAEITLTDTKITSTSTVDVLATANADASFTTTGINSELTQAPFILSIGYGETNATAKVNVLGSTAIEAGGTIQISSLVYATTDVEARTMANSLASGTDDVEFAMSLAIAVANQESHVKVGSDALVHSTGGNISISALAGDDEDGISTSGSADAQVFNDGVGGVTIGIAVNVANVSVTVDGTVIADNPNHAEGSYEFDASSVVNVANDTIELNVPKNQELALGQELIYRANGSTVIGGLVDGATYVVAGVELVSENADGTITQRIKLAHGGAIDIDATTTDFFSNHKLSLLESLKFTPAQVADAGTGALAIDMSGLTTGDKVVYLGPASSMEIDLATATFEANAGGDKITITDGSPAWARQGLYAGQSISVIGTDLNDGTYEIKSFSADGNTLILLQTNQLQYEEAAELRVTSLPEEPSAVGGLVQGQEYEVVIVGGKVQLVDPDNAGSYIQFSETGTGIQGFAIRRLIGEFSPWLAVDNNDDTITLANHGLSTGDLIVYNNDPNSTYVSDIYEFDSNQNATVIGSATLVSPEIEGLKNGHGYYVIKIDDNRFRLSTNPVGAYKGEIIDLTSQGGGDQLLETSSSFKGISIRAEMIASNAASAGVALSDSAQDVSAAVANFSDPVSMLAGARALYQAIRANNSTTPPNPNPTPPDPATTPPDTGAPVDLSGTIAINILDHNINATIGSTATLRSGADLEISSHIEQSVQMGSSSEATRDGVDDTSQLPDERGDTELAIAVAVGVYNNSAITTVKSGAVMDAAGLTSVTSNLDYPILIDNFLDVINPVETLKESGLSAFDFLLSGDLGLSGFYNVQVTALAGAKDESADKVAIGAAVAVTVYNNESHAIIEGGVSINQDETLRSGEQAVLVDAQTQLVAIEVGQNSSFNLSATTLFEQSRSANSAPATQSSGSTARDFFSGFASPFGVSAKTSIGPAVLVNVTTNTTIAEIRKSRQLDVDAAASTGDTLSVPSDHTLRDGSAVRYNVESGQTAIDGLTDGGIYFAIVDDADPSKIRLAATRADALAGIAVSIDTSGLAADAHSLTGITEVYTGPGSPDDEHQGLTVTANQDLLNVVVVQTGGKASEIGFTASVAVGVLDTDTIAGIGEDARITGWGVNVNAVDDVTKVGIAGAFQLGRQAGVGVSVSINAITRDVDAYIGSKDITTSANAYLAGGLIDVNDDVVVDADMTGSIFSLVIGGTLQGNNPVSGTPPPSPDLVTRPPTSPTQQNSSPVVALAFSVAVNVETNSVDAYIDGYSVEAPEVSVSADSEVQTQAIAIAAAVAADTPSSQQLQTNNSTFQLAGAGAVVVNDKNQTINAFISDSSIVTTTGGVSVTARDKSTILADAGGVALAISLGSKGISDGTTSLAIGFSIGVNDISGSVSASIRGSSIDSSGDVLVKAVSEPKIDVLTIAGAASVVSGSGTSPSTAISIAGAGAGSGNVIGIDVDADILNGKDQDGDGIDVNSHTGKIDVLAFDNSMVLADAGGVAISFARVAQFGGSKSTSVSIGVSAARNEIKNTTDATVENAILSAEEDVTVETNADAFVHALTLGGAAGGLALTGAGSGNFIRNQNKATVRNASVTSRSGAVNVRVSDGDNAKIEALAGTIALSFYQGSSSDTTFNASFGISLTVNEIDNDYIAKVDGAVISASTNIDVDAKSTAIINAISFAGSVAIGINPNGNGFGLAGAGTGSGNKITNVLEAAIISSPDVASQGSLSVKATDSSTISATAVAAAINVTVAKQGASIAIGASVSVNTIENDVKAHIDGSKVRAAGPLTIAADSTSTITATTIAAAISVGVTTDGVSVSGALGVTVSINSVKNDVFAYVGAGSDVGTTNAGQIDISAKDLSNITATNVEVTAGISVAANTLALNVTINSATSINTVANNVKAYIDTSIVASDGGLALLADSDATVTATTVLVSVGVTVQLSANDTGVTISLSAAVAKNDIDNTTHAYISGPSVVSTGTGQALSLTAIDNSTIKAVNVAIDAKGTVTINATGININAVAAVAINHISNSTKAYISGVASPTDPDKMVNAGGSLTLSATDTATITSDAVAVAISVAVGGKGVAIGFSAAVSENIIGRYDDAGGNVIVGTHEINASISASKVRAAGDVMVDAKSTATIT
ncbi:LEPR-XLL domain-containing protein, partial [Roseibium sp.]|uniref:LEPR-XLL domain-containing protein n=1 Tax=Roseibium sp. TaxID=1936156 RepID=UPI003D0E1E3B